MLGFWRNFVCRRKACKCRGKTDLLINLPGSRPTKKGEPKTQKSLIFPVSCHTFTKLQVGDGKNLTICKGIIICKCNNANWQKPPTLWQLDTSFSK